MRSSPVCHNLTAFVTEQSLSNNAGVLHLHRYLPILHCRMLPTDLKAPMPSILGNYNHPRTDPRQQTSLVNPKIDPTPEWPTHLIPKRPMSLIAQHYTWSAALAFVEKGAFRRSQAVLSPKLHPGFPSTWDAQSLILLHPRFLPRMRLFLFPKLAVCH